MRTQDILVLAQQMAAGEGTTLAALSANAKRKQYDMTVGVRITESGTGKAFFDTSVAYTGLPYGSVVIIETLLLDILNKLNELGQVVAMPPPPGAVPPEVLSPVPGA